MFDDQNKKQGSQDEVEDIFKDLDSVSTPENLPVAPMAADDAAPASSMPSPTPPTVPKLNNNEPKVSDPTEKPMLNSAAADQLPEKKTKETALPEPIPASYADATKTEEAKGASTQYNLGNKAKKSGSGMLILIAIISLLIIAAGVFIAIRLVTNQPFTDNAAIEGLTNDAEEQDMKNDDVLAPDPVAIDSDGDGLSDEEESTYGTDPSLPDTDGDGLFDREEVRVYETDPLNQDTDGDGFIDGDEVDNGYSPKGAGRLFIPPTQQK